MAYGGAALTWAAFAAASRRIAQGLAAAGIGPGDRVAIWLSNRPEYLIALFACARLGVTVVHINTRFRAPEVQALLDRTRPSALLTAPPLMALLPEILADARGPLRFVIGLDAGGVTEVGGLPVMAWAALDAAPERLANDATAETACLTFTTSGTTSGPKLVLHTQGSIATHARDVAAATGTDGEGAALLSVVPLCGTFGLAFAMAGVAGGALIVTMERFDAEAADAAIRAHGISHLIGSDDMFLRIAAVAGERAYAPFRFSGFASFSPGADRVMEVCGGLNMAPRGIYGSSEMQALFAQQDAADPIRARIGGGTPVSKRAEVRARDLETGILAAHGELEFRSPSMFSGYLNNPEATAKAMTADGFYRSGDLGRVHHGHSFDFETRIGDALRLGGFLVNPEEIEVFLKRQAGVVEAQVVGARGGTVAVAFVQGDAPDPEALRAACVASLARFKVPAAILALEAFPVTDSPNGVKIQRARLREMADAALAETV
ncbi:fatty-acyl-CoA synthase [Humitalea rosea]|uniref:Fatty-acyl-CoA synthase n=2 Tax=Humitalea rosea TaxID=990373 RepID=A0A2W7IH31_9PROT|nr:fatty-acyl-CoA synthase [Humitalea rosea]